MAQHGAAAWSKQDVIVKVGQVNMRNNLSHLRDLILGGSQGRLLCSASSVARSFWKCK